MIPLECGMLEGTGTGTGTSVRVPEGKGITMRCAWAVQSPPSASHACDKGRGKGGGKRSLPHLERKDAKPHGLLPRVAVSFAEPTKVGSEKVTERPEVASESERYPRCGTEAGGRRAADRLPRPTVPLRIPSIASTFQGACIFIVPTAEVERVALWEALDEEREPNNLGGGDDALEAAARALLIRNADGSEPRLVIASKVPVSSDRDQLECATFREVYARACSIALGVPVHRHDPLVKALMAGRERTICALFAGPRRDGDVEDWAWRQGGVAACYDTQRDRVHGDLTSGAVCGTILAAALAGWWVTVIMAMPCQSFTCMKLVPVPPGEPEAPPLRLRSALPGVPECAEGWEPYFSKHERFVLWGWDVAAATLEWEGGRLIAEHPVDRGDPRKVRFYRDRFAEHAPLSLHPRTLEMKERFGVRELDVVQCMSRCPHEKGTTLFADEETWESLQAAALPCLHENHKECAGKDASGNSISEQSSYWSSEMNKWVVLGGLGGSYAAVRSAALDAAAPEVMRAGLHKEALRLWEYRPVGEIPVRSPFSELGLQGAYDQGLAWRASPRACRRKCGACLLEPAVRAPASAPAKTRPEPLLRQVRQQRGGLGASGEEETRRSVSVAWRSAVKALPEHWEERGDAELLADDEARSRELRFCSRRRAVPEEVAALRDRALPLQAPPPKTDPVVRPSPPSWPRGAPPPPLHVEALFIKGAGKVDEIYRWGREGSAAVRHDLGEAAEGDERSDAPATFTVPLEELHEWARDVPGGWDTTDVLDVVPVGMRDAVDSLRARAQGDVDEFLIREWAHELGSEDHGMLSQIDGAISGSTMKQDSVFMYHHKGFQLNAAPAAELIDKEEAEGRVSRGHAFPLTIPGRVVAYNVVCVAKHKQQGEEFVTKLKWRVTTDDSIAMEGFDSRNKAIDKTLWPDHNLCAVQHLAEAIAMMRTARSPEALFDLVGHLLEAISDFGVPWEVCERVVLWALDLSDAYRMIAVHWSELWHQGFIWKDGFRCNYRCLFGTSHMVGFFQRVSLSIKARGDRDMQAYDAMLPPAVTTQAWMHRLGQQLAGYSMMYLDDELGASFLAAGARLKGAHRTSSTLAGVESRPQAHQRLAAQRFKRSGWAIAAAKVELDWRIIALGIGVDAGDDPGCEHDGDMFCPEAKRRGMLGDIQALLPERGESGVDAAKRTTPRGPIDTLVGRLGNMSQIEPACKPHLAPCFAVVSARRKRGGGGGKKGTGVKRQKVTEGMAGRQTRPPRSLHLHGGTAPQVAFQEAMQWWRAALERGLASPLAPKRSFPPLDAPGVAVIFTDAARENGTGVGGYSPIRRDGQRPTLLYTSEEWPQWALRALQGNDLSMPAGEGFGVVAVLDALIGSLEGVSHVYVFTDCIAARAAINSEASGSPQINELIRWLLARHPHIQLLAFHQPGKRNRAADGLSRNGYGGELASTILHEAREAGMQTEELELTRDAWDALEGAARLPQRAEKGSAFLSAGHA